MQIYFNLRKTPFLNKKKINIHAYIINTNKITLNMHKMVLLQMVPHSINKFTSSTAGYTKAIMQLVTDRLSLHTCIICKKMFLYRYIQCSICENNGADLSVVVTSIWSFSSLVTINSCSFSSLVTINSFSSLVTINSCSSLVTINSCSSLVTINPCSSLVTINSCSSLVTINSCRSKKLVSSLSFMVVKACPEGAQAQGPNVTTNKSIYCSV